MLRKIINILMLCTLFCAYIILYMLKYYYDNYDGNDEKDGKNFEHHQKGSSGLRTNMISLGRWIILFFLQAVHGSKYIISTTGCKIKDFNMTFDDKLLPKKFTSCGERYVFIEKVAVNKIQFVLKKDVAYCCYSHVSRLNIRYFEESDVTYSPCVVFKNQSTVDLKGDIIAVKCDRFGSYTDYYAVVKKNTNAEANKHSYNALLLGIDTMSRKRVHNSMKETINFLKKNEWLDFHGYNKIAANTQPNLTPLLTGKLLQSGPTSFLYSCYVNMTSCNDLFLWSEYRKEGYVTAFVEDTTFTVSSIIRDVLKTSPLLPTEHYIGPIFKISSEYISTSCSGKLSCGDQILNYASDFAETYKENKFFGFFWIGTQSHDITNSPMSFDESVAKFFVNIKKSGVLDNTFVIFLSDHGIRFGKTRYQIEAYQDERLPMFFMHVPDKFKRNHEEKYTNLQLNKHRLISPFDLHLTLKNIMNLNREPVTIEACQNCMSLFQRVPENRRCTDAGIDDIYCTCFEIKVTALEEKGAQISVKKASAFVQEFSKNVRTRPNTRCQDNYLIKVLRIHTFYSNRATKYYIVAFIVNPAVVYEVVVRRLSESNGFRYNAADHQMISKYVGGHCVLDYRKPFTYSCVCTSAGPSP